MSFEITREQIESAAMRVEPYIRRTPVIQIGDVLGMGFDLSLKLDQTQPTGSFKVRGAFALLTEVPSGTAVAAASGGNFGAAVAFAASRLGLDATVFVPGNSPEEKTNRIRSYGADVQEIPGFYDEALEACTHFVEESGAFMAHAFDQPDVVAGQGSCAREIGDQLPGTDSVVVAVGGGGLIGGIASWFRDDAKVIAAEPELCPSFNAAVEAGHPVTVDVGGVASSSLGARQIGEHSWHASRWVDVSVLVSEEAIVEAQHWLWSELRLAVEPSAATTIAALASGAYQAEAGEQVVAILSGANFDPSSL